MRQELKNIIKSSTILLAEDDIFVRKTFSDVLKLYCDNVIESQDGEEALDLFKSLSPNIIFSDVKMPKMDGLTLAREIRNIDQETPIVIISAYSEQNILLEFIKLHLVEYIIKPIKHSEFITVLEKCANLLEQRMIVKMKLSENCIYDKPNKTIIFDSKKQELTTKEVGLLELLIKNKNKLVTKEMIEYELYENKPMGETSLRNLVFKLRKKMNPNIIKTMGSHGFTLSDF
jgi:DNA-binding response OmpR family regulator